jgi:hypothetical protein
MPIWTLYGLKRGDCNHCVAGQRQRGGSARSARTAPIRSGPLPGELPRLC